MFKKGYKGCFFVNPFTNQSNAFAHGESSQYGAYTKTGDMTEKEEGHAGCDDEAGNVISNFDFGIGQLRDIYYFAREKVCWDNRQFAAIRECDAEAKDEIAQHKIEDSQRHV